MTNTIRLKITCFLLLFTVLLIKDILDLASCHKDETDMEFVQKFTPPDFRAKNFTPSISPNFNSFSKKKHRKNE